MSRSLIQRPPWIERALDWASSGHGCFCEAKREATTIALPARTRIPIFMKRCLIPSNVNVEIIGSTKQHSFGPFLLAQKMLGCFKSISGRQREGASMRLGTQPPSDIGRKPVKAGFITLSSITLRLTLMVGRWITGEAIFARLLRSIRAYG